ncbi:hypothetical protein F5882DRAFT_523065 [Hyaloscypha sp. PMI_1271]|nr:hypothetical protein F5882DRAFT_523065 [Hyaloscypha sp. PMI_1271]
MAPNNNANNFALPACQREQPDALSNIAVNGSVESENYSIEFPEPAVTAELQSHRLDGFLASDPPYSRRSQSVAAAIRSMAQTLQAFDIAFEI